MKTPMIEADFLRQIEPQPVFLQPAEPAPIIAPMTVGIAAICANGEAIVMAADRRVTYERTASLEYESEHAKILQISEHALTAITGSLTDADAAEEMLASAISLPDL